MRLAPLALVTTLAATGVPPLGSDGCCDMPPSHCNRASRMVACGCDASAQPASEAVAPGTRTLASPNLLALPAAAPPVVSQPVLITPCRSVGPGRLFVPLSILHVTLLI
jgi:hypothetical protein